LDKIIKNKHGTKSQTCIDKLTKANMQRVNLDALNRTTILRTT